MDMKYKYITTSLDQF